MECALAFMPVFRTSAASDAGADLQARLSFLTGDGHLRGQDSASLDIRDGMPVGDTGS